MGEDFMLYGTMQTFYQDNTSVCLQLRIINDRRIEYTESFAIEISLDNPDDSIVGVNRTEISIADDDCKLLSICYTYVRTRRRNLMAYITWSTI